LPVLPTDLTVRAVVEKDGEFLLIEEDASGQKVITQPGGHIEGGESPEQAVVREVLEESGCDIAVAGLLGVYLWIHPQTRQQFLKVVFAADLLKYDAARRLDDGVRAVHWLSCDDINRRSKEHRSPVVMRCVDDYLAGRRQPDTLLSGMLPLQHNVGAVMASAALV